MDLDKKTTEKNVKSNRRATKELVKIDEEQDDYGVDFELDKKDHSNNGTNLQQIKNYDNKNLKNLENRNLNTKESFERSKTIENQNTAIIKTQKADTINNQSAEYSGQKDLLHKSDASFNDSLGFLESQLTKKPSLPILEDSKFRQIDQGNKDSQIDLSGNALMKNAQNVMNNYESNFSTLDKSNLK